MQVYHNIIILLNEFLIVYNKNKISPEEIKGYENLANPKFKGKIGVFEINKNTITHLLNFYSIENNKFKKIF